MSFKAFVWMVCVFDDASSMKGAIVNFYNELYCVDQPGRLFFKAFL